MGTKYQKCKKTEFNNLLCSNEQLQKLFPSTSLGGVAVIGIVVAIVVAIGAAIYFKKIRKKNQ